MTAVRVLIADDQKIVRDGLAALLGMLEGIEVAGTAVDGDDAIRQARRSDPDVVLMDLHMPHCTGVEATERMAAAGMRQRVVVLTTYPDDEWVFAALRAGARGFLTKDAGAAEIRQAILAVADGEAQLDPTVQRRLLEAFTTAPAPAASGVQPAEPEVAPDGLTPREVDVLRLIADGRANGEIAAELYVSEATVKTHITHLLAKTGMRDRAQLVRYAFTHRLATP